MIIATDLSRRTATCGSQRARACIDLRENVSYLLPNDAWMYSVDYAIYDRYFITCKSQGSRKIFKFKGNSYWDSLSTKFIL